MIKSTKSEVSLSGLNSSSATGLGPIPHLLNP